jgi:hypothetical protein
MAHEYRKHKLSWVVLQGQGTGSKAALPKHPVEEILLPAFSHTQEIVLLELLLAPAPPVLR